MNDRLDCYLQVFMNYVTSMSYCLKPHLSSWLVGVRRKVKKNGPQPDVAAVTSRNVGKTNHPNTNTNGANGMVCPLHLSQEMQPTGSNRGDTWS